MPPRQGALGPGLARVADALVRRNAWEFSRRDWLRRAAVAVVLREQVAGVELLLAQRARSPGDRWSGHLAFPGGLEQPGDADAWATAARETLEEAGLDLVERGCRLGALSQLVTARPGSLAPLVVAPLVFATEELSAVVLGPELAAVHWVSLDELARARSTRSRLGRALGWFSAGRGERVTPVPLWGLTLAFVDDLVALLGPSEGQSNKSDF